jgi:hypothetical protein
LIDAAIRVGPIAIAAARRGLLAQIRAHQDTRQRRHAAGKLLVRDFCFVLALGNEFSRCVFQSSHTCFFQLDLPPYSGYEVLREKLLYAIKHCQVNHQRNLYQSPCHAFLLRLAGNRH